MVSFPKFEYINPAFKYTYVHLNTASLHLFVLRKPTLNINLNIKVL